MLRFQTAGESHGGSFIGIIEGLPAGLEISETDVDHELQKRQLGNEGNRRMDIESDRIEFISGISNGVTLGSPVGFSISNRARQAWSDAAGENKVEAEDGIYQPRPGHADLPGAMKYHHADMNKVWERASARETVARVAVGAVCKRFLQNYNIYLYGQVLSIGETSCPTILISKDNLEHYQKSIDASPLRCANPEAEKMMLSIIRRAQEAGESIGGSFEIGALGVPPGIGSYVSWDRRLDANIAGALMSIPGIKAVEIGDGVSNAIAPGSVVHDQIYYEKSRGIYRETNRAGGIEGGMSNGETIWARAYMKPVPTLKKALLSVNTLRWQEGKAVTVRSEVCAVPAASVVGEAMMAFVLAQEFLNKFGGDHMAEIDLSYNQYLHYLQKEWRWEKT